MDRKSVLPVCSLFFMFLVLLASPSFLSIRSGSISEFADETETYETVRNSILILINETIYPSILDRLTIFEQDLTSTGYNVTISKIGNGHAPPQVKNIIKSCYLEHSINGCILIGDVKAAYTESRTGDSQTVQISLDALDMYYMDLDGYWENITHPDFMAYRPQGDTRQVNHDPSCQTFYEEYIVYPNETTKWDYGRVENRTQYEAEIWVSRIMAHNLAIPGENETDVINDFLAWDHAFRSGERHIESLAYLLETGPSYEYQDMNYTGLFTSIEEREYTTASYYLNCLGNRVGSELTYLGAHSTPQVHAMYFSDLTVEELANSNKTSIFYILNACSACRWDNYVSNPSQPNYLGGIYVFDKDETDYGLGAIGFTGVGGFNALNFLTDYLNTNRGGSYGEAFKYWFNENLMHTTSAWNYVYLGDPTIGPRAQVQNLDTGLNYATIQEAIDAPETLDGHRIRIAGGTYHESLLIYKSLSLEGEDKATTVLEGYDDACTILRVYADFVNITGLTICNSEYGLRFMSCSDCMITDAVIADCQYGICLDHSTRIRVTTVEANSNYLGIDSRFSINCILDNNTVEGNTFAGIQFRGSTDCHISGNSLNLNGVGLLFFGSTGCIISENEINNNGDGIDVDSSFNCTIRENSLNDGSKSISIQSSVNCAVMENTISAYTWGGIWVSYSNNTILMKNVIENGTLGISLTNSWNNAIVQNRLRNNQLGGIEAMDIHDSQVSGNIVAGYSDRGIWLFASDHCEISHNSLENSNRGLELQSLNHSLVFYNMVNNSGAIFSGATGTFENTVFHNCFINASFFAVTETVRNSWDDGFEGNYWSNYTGQDIYCGPYRNESGSDGIGDTQYIIDSNNTDNYPLMGIPSDFSATSEHHVQAVCNSTISGFQINGTAISFYVAGENGTTGFCRICIPTSLMNDTFEVFIDGTKVDSNILQCSNANNTYLYFNYTHSTKEVIIIPEFPSLPIPLLLIIATLLAVIVHRKKHSVKAISV